MPRQIVDDKGVVISEEPEDDDYLYDDEADECDCLDYDEDILTGCCICDRCGRRWYK